MANLKIFKGLTKLLFRESKAVTIEAENVAKFGIKGGQNIKPLQKDVINVKKVYEGPKFVDEKTFLKQKQAELKSKIAEAKQVKKRVSIEFVNDMTIKPVVNQAKRIAKGYNQAVSGLKNFGKNLLDSIVGKYEKVKTNINNCCEEFKFNIDLMKEKRTIQKQKIAELKVKQTEIQKAYKTRVENTLNDNARIAEENVKYEVEQKETLAAAHKRGEDYYAELGKLEKIRNEKQALLDKLAKMKKQEEASKLNLKTMDQSFRPENYN